ncbi:ankyrin repeat-containing domain protein [Flagelloscypha sp. PMI_526]|nr:ankyrin repeat-containing domain protein [Flagelloscypha sp. PMI_526]
MAGSTASKDLPPLTALAFDGTSNTINALSELYILQDAAGRWAHDSRLSLRGEDVCPSDMFDIMGGTGIGGFYAVLFARLELNIGQVIRAHRVLEERLFTTETWSQRHHANSLNAFNTTLDEIFAELDIEICLDSAFEDGIPSTKCVVCILSLESAEACRLLCNYRPRRSHSPHCTIRQVLHATFADCIHLPPVRIQDEDFISALNGYANPTHVLMKELAKAFPKRPMVACVASIGAGYSGPQRLTNTLDPRALARLLESSEVVANEFASQCHELGAFFIRLSLPSQLSYTDALDQAFSRVKGATIAYLDTKETTQKLDDLVELLMERPEVLSLGRLGSLAGKDGQSELMARVQKVQEKLDDSIFRDINAWLQPIHQTSKLDANIQARGETTCEWILQNETFVQWIKALGGLFWYHGLMGTGKTFTSSFVIQRLLRRDDIYVAYYYFEFTNPITLSEEALHRSLVSQLAPADPAAIRDLHQKHHHGAHQPQLATLQTTLKNLVSASPKPVFIVIDALDELPPALRKYLLTSLSLFCYSSGAARTHVMVTSREDRDIQDALDGKVDFQLGVQGDLVRQDIAAYVDQQLAVRKWTLWPSDLVELMRQVLNKRADGQFRMVACQVDILMQAKTTDMLVKSLHSLPTTLGKTYEYILNQIHEGLRCSARILFAFLSFASNPISVMELSALVAVDFCDQNDSDQPPVFQEGNLFRDPLDLLDLGSSLLLYTTEFFKNGSLQLAHASVKEFLLADSRKWFALQEGPAHNLIASACLAILLHFQGLMRKAGDLSFPFSYSLNWFNHIFPNGPPELLGQQKALYATHPWTSSNLFYCGYQTKCLLKSAASFGLVDLLETSLVTREWDENVWASALVAAAGSPRSSLVALRCCQLLICHGGHTYNCKALGRALHSASENGHVLVAQFLVEKGADVNIVGGKYWTALQGATARAQLEVVRFLVEKGADVNAVGGEYGTALQAAARHGHLEIVHFLVEKGADVNSVGGTYATALQAGARRGSLDVVRFLVNHRADVLVVAGRYGTALQAAAVDGFLEVIQFLVEKGADVNAVGGYYGTALQAAATPLASLQIIHFLVEMGADVCALGGHYGTALQAAATIDSLELVQFLVEMGADVNIVGGEYGTALQAAAGVGNLEIVQFLVEKGADVNVVGGHYGTALQAAAAHECVEVIQFLEEKGADVNAVGGIYGTALHAAAAGESLEVIEVLVEMGADLHAMAGLYGTALQTAAGHGNQYFVQALMEMGADIHAVGGQYGSALQAAAAFDSLEVIQFLVKLGVDINGAGGEYGTVLQTAVECASPETIHFLVEMGADVNARGGKYETALQASAHRGCPEIFQFLMEMGADDSNAGGRHRITIRPRARSIYVEDTSW